MEYKHEINIRRAFAVDEEKLKSIISLAEKYEGDKLNRTTIYAKLKNKNELKCNSFEELLAFKNNGNDRIVELRIFVYGDNYTIQDFFIWFKDPEILFWGISKTAVITCTLPTKNEAKQFEAGLLDIFEEMYLPWSYTVFTRLPFLVLHILFIGIMWVLILASITSFHNDGISPLFFIMAGFVLIFLLMIFALKKFQAKFPSVFFKWGEEKNRLDKLTASKNKVFWYFFIPIIIGIILIIFGSIWNSWFAI